MPSLLRISVTPASEIAEAAALYLPQIGGTFLQAESEIAAINMVYGASAAGVRVMSSSSGPGLRLMQEGISYLEGAELPCVIVVSAGHAIDRVVHEENGDFLPSIRGYLASSLRSCASSSISFGAGQVSVAKRRCRENLRRCAGPLNGERRPANEGFPVHVSELLSAIEAPAYIERVALSDNKNIMKTRRAIRKALEIQRDGVGFSFVEILSPCPTIWGMEPVEAHKWVAEKPGSGFSVDDTPPPQRTAARFSRFKPQRSGGRGACASLSAQDREDRRVWRSRRFADGQSRNGHAQRARGELAAVVRTGNAVGERALPRWRVAGTNRFATGFATGCADCYE
jgi:Pyruvate flavodoxin/ferredoxin oxidoreductase, thiamine diP-bdg